MIRGYTKEQALLILCTYMIKQEGYCFRAVQDTVAVLEVTTSYLCSICRLCDTQPPTHRMENIHKLYQKTLETATEEDLIFLYKHLV